MCVRKIFRIVAVVFFVVQAGRQNVWAVDIFSWLGMADRPLGISAPAWATRGSNLRLEIDSHEYYKRWVENRLVSDFSGSSTRADLTIQLLPSFAVGVRKKFTEPQTWKNSMDDRSDRFCMKSEAESGDIFFRVARRSFAVEAGGGSGKSFFTGDYELHRDLINALGANPPIYLNNGETVRFAKFYGTRGRLRFAYAVSGTKYAHRVSANTPALDIVLNHDREVRQQSAELSWSCRQGFAPYIRFDDYRDQGNGENFRDIRYKFGNNSSEFAVSGVGLGSVYRYKGTRYFAEFSRLNLDLDLATDFNLITLNPLFLFGTNRVAYRLGFHPHGPWALRLGGQRMYRGIDYFAQYSFAAVSGVVSTWSAKDFDMFANTTIDLTESDTKVDLHRFSLSMKRPDSSGNWQLNLNLLVPLAESVEQKPPAPPTPAPAPGPARSRPEESIRGGWQIVVGREFNL